MLSISYKDVVINKEVLRRANVDRTLMKEIVKRQIKFFGHVIRKEELALLLTKGGDIETNPGPTTLNKRV